MVSPCLKVIINNNITIIGADQIIKIFSSALFPYRIYTIIFAADFGFIKQR
jgi:hypothetical protein